MTKNIIPFTDIEQRIAHKLADKRESAAERFPLFFGLAATFGFVSILYGFEKLIDSVPLFVNNPWILLAAGLLTLLATGAAYKKLS